MSAIRVSGVEKTFRRSGAHHPRRLKDLVLHGRGPAERFKVLSDVSFYVESGSVLGLIGPNGAGKSTLLRVIGGIVRPDRGTVDVEGRLGAVFELGTGFHPDLTGREGAILAGVISGLRRADVVDRLDDIVAFAELEDFIDEPLRAYSSGMTARLAFSVSVHLSPDVLLVDEVLAVGDLSFYERCMERMRAFKRAGTTMVVVSHDPTQLTELCDRVLWLQGGRIVVEGPPDEIGDRYTAAMRRKTIDLTPDDVPDVLTPGGARLRIGENRFGSQEAQITSVDTFDGLGRPARQISSGDAVRLSVAVDAPEEIGDVRIGVQLLRDDGVVCLDTSTAINGRDGRSASATLELERLDLAAGGYRFDVGLYTDDWDRPLDFHSRAYPLEVRGERGGVLAPPLRWRVER